MAYRSSRLGGVTKGTAMRTTGFDELERRTAGLTRNVRLFVILRATEMAADEVHEEMARWAARSDGSPTHGDGHAADNLINEKLYTKRDKASRFVGLDAEASWWLMWEEVGADHITTHRPFIKPTAQKMRKRVEAIIMAHWARAVGLLGPPTSPLDPAL